MNKPGNLRLIIFDMDGTITRPFLDFDAIKREIGAPPDMLVLEFLKGLKGEERERKFSILHQFEDDAAHNASIQPGASELLQELHSQGFILALLTRNSGKSVDIILKDHGFHFDHIFTRDNAPAKPDPSPINELLAKYRLEKQQAVIIGDFWMDILTGQAAGIRTILIPSGELSEREDAEPDARVTSFEQLGEILDKWNG